MTQHVNSSRGEERCKALLIEELEHDLELIRRGGPIPGAYWPRHNLIERYGYSTGEHAIRLEEKGQVAA